MIADFAANINFSLTEGLPDGKIFTSFFGVGP